MKIVLNSFTRTLDFKGRSTRKELFFYILFLVILLLIAFIFERIYLATVGYYSASLYIRTGIIFFFFISLLKYSYTVIEFSKKFFCLRNPREILG